MLFEPKTVRLKNGEECLLRSPTEEDAEGMLAYLKTCSEETDFVMRYPEECSDTYEQEQKYLASVAAADTNMMIACEVGGKIVGNCQINFNKWMKARHRAKVAIAIVKAYWNLGIGTVFFEEMIKAAEQRGVTQLELEFIEGNVRGRALYEKMGFRIISYQPDAIRLKDGTMLGEYAMIKKL